MVLLWYAPNATLKISSSTMGTITTGSTLKTQFDALTEIDWTGEVKDVKISGGDRDVTKYDLLGRNQEKQYNRPSMVEVSLTVVGMQGVAMAEYLHGTATTIATDYKRVQGGEKATNDRVPHALLFYLNDTSIPAEAIALMDKADCVSIEHNLTADGIVEDTVKFKCLGKDYYEEFKGLVHTGA